LNLTATARSFAATALAATTVAALALGGTSAPARAAAAAAPARPDANVVTFNPGTPWDDTAGSPLQMHGLGIIQVGKTWYAYGEDKAGENASNTSFQAIPCYSSTNLKDWTFRGDALTVQASGDLGPDRIVERPKVIYNSTTHMYVMWMHIDNESYFAGRGGRCREPHALRPVHLPRRLAAARVPEPRPRPVPGHERHRLPAHRGPGQRPAHRRAVRQLSQRPERRHRERRQRSVDAGP
jgi:hypothetical protein